VNIFSGKMSFSDGNVMGRCVIEWLVDQFQLKDGAAKGESSIELGIGLYLYASGHNHLGYAATSLEDYLSCCYVSMINHQDDMKSTFWGLTTTLRKTSGSREKAKAFNPF